MAASAQNFEKNDLSATDMTAMPVILVVEDDLALREAIVDTLELEGLAVLEADSGERALQTLDSQAVNLVISDVNMGGMDGHQLLARIRESYPLVPVMLITAYASIQRSVEAMRSGAVDYLVKPFEPRLLVDLVKRYANPVKTPERCNLIAEDPVTRKIVKLAQRVAATESTVLLSGPSGTGKEVLAQYIHASSPRSDGPFVAINCAAIPDSMLEATLFGHEKGAFTGAHQASSGKFEQANDGTLLLDEISEMDLALQAKLLRVIQEREVERVGGKKTIKLNVRILATTNRDLRSTVEAGHFREDLYYRLSVFPLELPALETRSGDILPLARMLLKQHCERMGRSIAVLSPSAQQALLGYRWPGNVRELDNVIQRALIMQSGPELHEPDFMFEKIPANSPITVAPEGEQHCVESPPESDLESGMKHHEYRLIESTLQAVNGSRKEAADTLGISPRTLRYKLAQMREAGYVI